ncbi:MAG TPA: hypothetical protein VMI94_13335 [Bryobacteraceae bacterium]|nr:hypothetical protein [Bryobacteraceae bacterium]
MAEWRPKRVLILTGWNWAQPFLSDWPSLQVKKAQGAYVDGAFQLDWGPRARTVVVVSKHPQGKPGARLLEEILGAFR